MYDNIQWIYKKFASYMEEIKYQESNVKAREVQVGLAKGCISNLNVGGKSKVKA